MPHATISVRNNRETNVFIIRKIATKKMKKNDNREI